MMKKEDAVKKFKKKIKIRLLDPNDPNSYVCEISDSSLEEDGVLIINDEDRSNKALVTKNENIHNYFEILMSKNLKKNNKNPASKENLKIIKKTRKIQSDNNFFSDSSDDESFCQFQARHNSKSLKGIKNSNDAGHFTSLANDSNKGDIETTIKSEVKTQKNNLLKYFANSGIQENLKKIKKNRNISKCKNIFNLIQENNSKSSLNRTFMESKQKKEIETIQDAKKENIKLAPVFLVKEKRTIDLATQKARYDFLHKETKLLKILNNQNVENTIDFQPTCHVQQRDDSALWIVRKINFLQHQTSSLYEFKATKAFSANIIGSDCSLNIEKTDSIEMTNKFVNLDQRLFKELKSKYSNLNFDRVIDGLKLKQDKFQKLSNSLRRNRGENNIEMYNSLWLEKYKPSSYEILGNEKVVEKLRNWLQTWQKFDREMKYLSETSRSKNDFEIIDEDEIENDAFFPAESVNLNLKAPGNVCIISGPNGCGKTALVSSLAEELEFNVLEVNSSSKRAGKKVLTDFQEATQSHKVLQLPQSTQSKKSVGPMRKSKSKSDSKMKKANKSTEEPNEKKISLILIEDADIVFEEHDEGFYSAVSFLVQTSKRPFVFVTDNPNCDQLENFKTEECLLLEMRKPSFDQACAVLDVVSHLENSPITKETAELLIYENNLDLRKSLLDLEFWNGSERGLRHNRKFDLGRFWWTFPKFLSLEETSDSFETVQYKRKRKDSSISASDVDGGSVSKKAKIEWGNLNRTNSAVFTESSSRKDGGTLNLFSTMLDVAVILDLIGVSLSEEPLPGFWYTPKSSSSLEENMESVRCGENRLKEELCREILEKMSEIAAGRHCCTKRTRMDLSFPSWDVMRWRNSVEETSNDLGNLIPQTNGRDGRSVHLDYLPIFRNICRTEKNRSVTNGKRKKRFNHYFSNFESRPTTKSLEVICEMFNRR